MFYINPCFPRLTMRHCLLIFMLTVLNGCASLNDKTLTQAQGAAAGCLAGGLVGFLIKQNPTAAAIGCVAGGAAGFVYGDHVAGKKEAYKNQEEYLKAVIDESTKVRDETHLATQQLKQEINSLNQQTKIKRGHLQTAKANTETILNKKERQKKILASSQAALTRVNNEIAVQQHVIEQEAKSSNSETIMLASTRLTELQQEERALKEALTQIASTNVSQEP